MYIYIYIYICIYMYTITYVYICMSRTCSTGRTLPSMVTECLRPHATPATRTPDL